MNEPQMGYSNQSQFRPVRPWPMPLKKDCVFYHSMDLPGGEAIGGAWDIRGGFEQYIGNYPISGKSVLDVGTASGFLAFNAEQAGAKVTALDALQAREIRHLQFFDTPFHADRTAWLRDSDGFLDRLKRSFWYAWHRLQSTAEVVYAPIEELPYWHRKFDVVIAGAIVEHLSDPVTAIGNMALLANEALIIPFTPVEDIDDQIMRTANDWASRQYCYTWWTLSRGLYRRIFDNLGFRLEFKTAVAKTNGIEAFRPTIIARRIV